MATVRLAREEDAPGIAQVHVAGWKTAYAGLVPDERLAGLDPVARADEWKRRLRDGDGTAVVAVLGEEVLGFSYFDKSRDDDAGETVGEIQAIYVHPAKGAAGLDGRYWTTRSPG